MPEKQNPKRGRKPYLAEGDLRKSFTAHLNPATIIRIKEIAKERGLSEGKVVDMVFAPGVLAPGQPEPAGYEEAE